MDNSFNDDYMIYCEGLEDQQAMTIIERQGHCCAACGERFHGDLQVLACVRNKENNAIESVICLPCKAGPRELYRMLQLQRQLNDVLADRVGTLTEEVQQLRDAQANQQLGEDDADSRPFCDGKGVDYFPGVARPASPTAVQETVKLTAPELQPNNERITHDNRTRTKFPTMVGRDAAWFYGLPQKVGASRSAIAAEIFPADVDDVLDQQHDCCAACGKTFSAEGQMLSVVRDEAGTVAKLLCLPCADEGRAVHNTAATNEQLEEAIERVLQNNTSDMRSNE